MKTTILLGFPFNKEALKPLHNGFKLICPEGKRFSKEEILEKINEVEVLVPGISTDKDIIDKGKNLQLIANFGAGYNDIDIVYATKKGITVTNTPNSVTEPTAELCFGLLLTAARRIAFYDHLIRTKEKLQWNMHDPLGVGLYGKTLGIIGMGRIGQAVARRAVASGMNIVYHNRNRLPEDIEKLYNAQMVNFEELLQSSDFISLNAPATADTENLISDKEFAQMKSSAILINAARGSLVNEQALIKALKEKRILGAGLDVYLNEPHINEELLHLDNVVLTPHAGTKTLEARLNMQKEVVENILGFYQGKKISKVN